MEETEKKETRQPKTIGIYKDEKGEFVVYKNKANGVRSVRYKGPDEAIAQISKVLN